MAKKEQITEEQLTGFFHALRQKGVAVCVCKDGVFVAATNEEIVNCIEYLQAQEHPDEIAIRDLKRILADGGAEKSLKIWHTFKCNPEALSEDNAID